MGIGPVPNIAAMPVATSAPSFADVSGARAVEFRRHSQEREEDATYTPGGGDKGEESESESRPEEQIAAAPDAFEAAEIPDEPPSEEPDAGHIDIFV